MAAHFVDIKLVITKKPKASYYDLSRDADNNMEHQTDSATQDNGLLAKRTIKNNTKTNKDNSIKTNKLKIIATTWNDDFELPGGSYSVLDIQYYIKHIIKNMKHFPLILLFTFMSRGLIMDSSLK